MRRRLLTSVRNTAAAKFSSISNVKELTTCFARISAKRSSRKHSHSPGRERNVTFTSNTNTNLPKTRRGTAHTSRTRKTTATSVASVGGNRTTDMTSAPSKADYTEAEITQERILEGKIHQFCGFVFFFLALGGFVTSMVVSTLGKIDNKVDRMIKYRTVVDSPIHELYDKFKWNLEPFPPMTKRFYLFHCTNRDQVLDGKAPVLEEKGPFVFQQDMIRVGMSFSYDKREVTYTRMLKHTFKEDAEWLWRLDEEVTMPSIPYVRAMYEAQGHGMTGEEVRSGEERSGELRGRVGFTGSRCPRPMVPDATYLLPTQPLSLTS